MSPDGPAGGALRPYQAELRWLARAGDLLWLFAVLWLSLALHGYPWKEKYALVAAAAGVLFYLSAEFFRLYRSWRGEPYRRELAYVCLVWVTVFVGILFLGYATKTTHQYSRLALGTWFLATPLALVGWRAVLRLALRNARRRGLNSRSAAIVGTGDLARRVARVIRESPWMGIRLRGFYDDSRADGGRVDEDLAKELRGDCRDLLELARRGRVDVVYLTLPIQGEERIRELVAELADTTASVYVVPDFFIFSLFHGRWVQLGGLPAVSVFETPFYGVDGWVKRVEDVVVASLVLALIALPMLVIAAGVKRSSPGPVIFRQRRYGLDGRPFRVWKFRTMTVCEDGAEMRQATRDDPRVTPFGAFLRRTSMDELPQFVNVLQGTMSVVGPRPHAHSLQEQYRDVIEGYMVRHKVKPGITGWAQANGWRGETEVPEKMRKRVEHDLWYIRNWSLLLDFKIMVLTVVRGLRGVGAY